MKSKFKKVSKKKEAELKKIFKTAKIEMAPRKKLFQVEELASDFVEHCLGCDCFMISDLSRVSDFCESEKKVIKKAKARYGVDITSVVDGYIVDIAGFILRESAN